MPGWLALDVGNTHAKAAVFDRDTGEILARLRFEWLAMAGEEDWAFSVSGALPPFERAVVSCGVAHLRPVISRALGKVLFIDSDTRRDFHLDRPHPERMGSDRLANIAAALTHSMGPVLIVDAGTATTFTLVDSRPAHVGGVIAPGLQTSYEALLDGAPGLLAHAPLANPREDETDHVKLARPAAVLGRDTPEQLASGAIHAHEALVQGLAERLCAEAGPEFARARWILTGGCSSWMQLGSRFETQPDLTLKGLYRYGQLTE